MRLVIFVNACIGLIMVTFYIVDAIRHGRQRFDFLQYSMTENPLEFWAQIALAVAVWCALLYFLVVVRGLDPWGDW